MGILNSDTGNLVYIVPQSSYYFSKTTVDQDEVAAGFETHEEGGFFDATPVNSKTDSRLILSATEYFSKTESAVTTNFPVSSGGGQGDHYRPNGPVIAFRGVISESSLTLIQGLQQLSSLISGETNEAFIESYISKVRDTLRMMKSTDGSRAYPLVNIHLPDNNSENNCLITNFKISRDKKVGNGYYVDITAQKLLITDSVFSVIPASDYHQQEVESHSKPAEVDMDDLISERIETKSEKASRIAAEEAAKKVTG